MISSFSQYLIEEESTVYFTFGRMNPPTIGHGKLLDKLASKSGRNPYKIFLSQSQDSKKNPLTYTDKIKHVRKMFPKHGRQVMINKKIRTAIEAVVALYNQGYKSVVMVVGDDRVREFDILLNKYNGKKGPHGIYNFSSINTVSAGSRDPDSEGVDGMSASKMRAAAAEKDFTSFSQGLPKAVSNPDAKALYNKIRSAMGLKEQKEFKNHLQLESVSKYTSKILICFDNDEAGLKATERVLEIKNQISKQVEIHCLNLPTEYKDISDIFESKPELFDDVLKDNDEIVEYLLNKFLKKESNKKSVFNYFRKITAKLSPLEVDIALDLLSAKLNTEKEILKRELNFQTEEEFEQVGETSLNSVSIFQDIVTANIVQNNFEISENEKEILSLNSDYANLISSLESDKNKSKEYQNISFLPDQYEEAVVRLYLYFANFKIETLINRFEQQEKKDFSLLQQVEDLKKKKEIYQNTI